MNLHKLLLLNLQWPIPIFFILWKLAQSNIKRCLGISRAYITLREGFWGVTKDIEVTSGFVFNIPKISAT